MEKPKQDEDAVAGTALPSPTLDDKVVDHSMIALNEIPDNSLAYHTQMSSDLSHNDVSSYFGPSTKQSPAIEGL